MSSVSLEMSISRRPLRRSGFGARQAPVLACQRVGGSPARATVTVIMVVAMLVAASLFCVWSRTEVVRKGYATSELAERIKALSAEHEELRARAASLKSTDRIEALARTELGMRYPEREQIKIVRIEKQNNLIVAENAAR